MFLDNAIHDLTNVVVYTVLIATMLPWFLLVLPVAGAAFMFLYAVFRVSIRRLQRYQLESMAPLLTHVDASVHGLSSVHAYQRVDHFQRRSVSWVFSKRELTFMFDICRCPSVRLSSVVFLSVCL